MHYKNNTRKRKKASSVDLEELSFEEASEETLEVLSLDDIADVISRDPEGRPVVEVEDL